MENIEKLFMQEIREKKRIGSNIFSRVSTRKGGTNQALRTPYLYMTRKERKQLNGKVKVFNMKVIIPYQEFKDKSESEQRELMMVWRGEYKASEIQDSMNISRTVFYKILDKLDIPKDKTKGTSPQGSEYLSDEDLDRFKSEIIPYASFRALVGEQKEQLLSAYLEKYETIAELARNWDGADIGYLYSINGRINRKKKRQEAMHSHLNEHMESDSALNIKTEDLISKLNTLIPESGVSPNKTNDVNEQDSVYDELVVPKETLESSEKHHDSQVNINTNAFTFNLQGLYNAKTIIKRVQLALDVLDDEEELLNLEIKISNK